MVFNTGNKAFIQLQMTKFSKEFHPLCTTKVLTAPEEIIAD